MCRIINDEDKTVPLAVERVLPDIAAAIHVIHAQVSGGGRLIYLGAEHPVVWGSGCQRCCPPAPRETGFGGWINCWRRICHSARGGRR
ncbi:hypothetical protein ACLB1E_15810 [Escherichia coli]